MRQMRRSNEDYREIRRYLSAVLKLRYHETFVRYPFYSTRRILSLSFRKLGEKGCPRNRMERKTRWKNKWKFEGKAMGKRWERCNGRCIPGE